MADDRSGTRARTALAAVVLPVLLTFALSCLADPAFGLALQPPQAKAPAAVVLTAVDDGRASDRAPQRDRPRGPRIGPPRERPGRDARGQTLQPEQRGQPLGDYRRFRLRRPPPGYSWRRVGDQAFLVSDETGTVTEAVPLGH